MWFASLRDLQWRFRRFLIAVIGTSLVFGLTLVMSGLSHGFRVEARRVVTGLGADGWVVATGGHGAFTSAPELRPGTTEAVRLLPGVTQADPILVLHTTLDVPQVLDVNVVGFRPGGIGTPARIDGRLPASGEAVADVRLGKRVGDSFTYAGRRTVIVGTVRGMTIMAGQPLVFIPIADAQRALGAPLASAILTRGRPTRLPASLTLDEPARTRRDLLRPLDNAVASIDLTQLLLWGVAALIIGSVVYLSALERVRDFAVFKATGAATHTLLVGLVLQAVTVALVSAVLAFGAAHLIAPAFPIDVVIPGRALVVLPVIALAIGALASVAGLRRAVGVDPAAAFGGP